MSNWFTLELDTTPPDLEIIAPNYTNSIIETDISIISSEDLDQYQDIYIVDSHGNRHDMIFLYDTNRYTGTMILNDHGVGIVTIHARLRDVVGNISDVVMKSINILPTGTYDVDIDDNTRDIHTSTKCSDIKLNIDISSIDVGCSTADMDLHIDVSKIVASDIMASNYISSGINISSTITSDSSTS